MGLEGKTAVVTAAAQGIGRATAEAFAKAGARVWAADINPAKLAELSAIPGITTRTLDVTNDAQIRQFAAEAGPVHTLFNCAGFVHHGTILDCAPDAWNFSLNLNLTSMYRMIRALLPRLNSRTRLYEVADGDHSFKVRVKTAGRSQQAVIDALFDEAARFITDLSSPNGAAPKASGTGACRASRRSPSRRRWPSG